MKAFPYLILFSLLNTAWAGSGYFGSGNYWQCILDDMPGVKNDLTAEEILDQCKQEHSWPERIFVKKKKPWFGVKTASECTIKHSKNTPSLKGSDAIRAACYKLYDRQ